MCGKIMFCILELSGMFFFLSIFHPWLVEFMNVEPMDTEGQLSITQGPVGNK
jgi:hypothetical protein